MISASIIILSFILTKYNDANHELEMTKIQLMGPSSPLPPPSDHKMLKRGGEGGGEIFGVLFISWSSIVSWSLCSIVYIFLDDI